jgi:hypothetical protein
VEAGGCRRAERRHAGRAVTASAAPSRVNRMARTSKAAIQLTDPGSGSESATANENAYYVNNKIPAVVLIARGVRLPRGRWLRIASVNSLAGMASRGTPRKDLPGTPGKRRALRVVNQRVRRAGIRAFLVPIASEAPRSSISERVQLGLKRALVPTGSHHGAAAHARSRTRAVTKPYHVTMHGREDQRAPGPQPGALPARGDAGLASA